MYNLGALVGAFLITFLASRAFRNAFKRQTEPKRSLFGAAATLALAVGLASFGMADGGPPRFGYAVALYGPGVALWLIVDILRSARRQGERPPAE